MAGIKTQKVSKTKSFFKKVRNVFKRNKEPLEGRLKVNRRFSSKRFAFRSAVAGLTFLMLSPFISKGVQNVIEFFNPDYKPKVVNVAYAQNMDEERMKEIEKQLLKHFNEDTGEWDIVDTVKVSKEDVDKAFSMAPKYELTGKEKEEAFVQLMYNIRSSDKDKIEEKIRLGKEVGRISERGIGINAWKRQINNSKIYRIPIESQWGDKFNVTVWVKFNDLASYYIDALIEKEGQTEKPLKIVLPWPSYAQLLGITTGKYIEPPNGINSIKVGLDTYKIKETRTLEKDGEKRKVDVLITGITVAIGLNKEDGSNADKGFVASIEISIPEKDLDKKHETLHDYFYYSPNALIYYEVNVPLTLSKR